MMTVLVWLVGCEDPKPPVACNTIPEQTVHVTEYTLVTSCFDDPGSNMLSLAVESSDPEVVTAELLRDVVRLGGVSPGGATVTVTATNSDMLSAQSSFSVLVPNRPPEARGAIPSAQMVSGATAHRVLSDYFSEPDGQQLTYASASSDARVASPSVSADTLTVVGRQPGTATVTIEASDPGGLTAIQQVVVNVRPPQSDTLLRSDFESAESVEEWTIENASSEIRQGALWLVNTHPLVVGSALTSLSAEDWDVTVAMGNVNRKGWATLITLLEHDRILAYAIQIGADDNYFQLGETNYRFYVLISDEQGLGWVRRPEWSGVSDAIKRLGELTEVSMSVQGGSMTIAADTTELFNFDLETGGFPTKMNEVALGIWPLPGDVPGVAVFDYIEVVGLAKPAASSIRYLVGGDQFKLLTDIGGWPRTNARHY